MPVEDEARLEKFYAALVCELFVTTDRELKACSDQQAALGRAFEELFHRIDFETMDLVAGATYQTNVPRDGLRYTLIAMAFGSYLAAKGIRLNEKLYRSDH
jgi:hypothetical protein